MRQRDLSKFRTRLVDERDRIMKSLRRHETSIHTPGDVDARAHSNHIADQGTDEYNQEQLIKLTQSEGRYLYRIEDALKRIEDGTYGTCELCQQLISIERLEALPYTRMCIKCAEKEDAKRG